MAELLHRIQDSNRRFQAALSFSARVVGMMGLAGLAWCLSCTFLRDVPFPALLDRELLGMYTCLCLLASSFLGWACMLEGMDELRDRTGTLLGGVLFVVLPIAALLLVEAQLRDLVAPARWPNGKAILLVALWYPSAVTLVSLVAYVYERSEERGRVRPIRVVAAMTLVFPYLLLASWLLLGLPLPIEEVDEGLRSLVGSLGKGTVVAQILLAFFFGGTGRV